MENHPFTNGRWLNNNNHLDLNGKWINNHKYFAYMPIKKTKSIILGSFPIWQISIGEVTDDNFEFFYGSRYNDLWNCIGNLFNVDINNLENRLNILNKYEFGITDILKKIDRNPINSNKDKDLIGLKYNDILALKDDYDAIINIYTTSGGKGSIGNLRTKNVATWFKDSLNNNDLNGFNQKSFVKRITINNVKFNLIYLYSPSNSANTSIQGVLNKNNNFGIQNLDIYTFRRLQWGYFLKKFHFDNVNNIDNIENIWNQVNQNQQLLNFFEDNA
ncbi:hypothetical protein ACSVH5_02270 [Flavobacterium sp. RSSA_27]|uniref:hypothetical protein n=1 Tax=Flavobacterium sp. RSSA_27 TaxID=3447667 RepID=UPI003F40C347